MYLPSVWNLLFIKPIKHIHPIPPPVPQLLHANYLVQSPERKLRPLVLTPPSPPLSFSVEHVPCGLRDPGTQIHLPPPQRPFHLWKRRLIAIHALSGSPHANRSCSVRWGLGGGGLLPRRDSDGPADEQFAKSRFHFARKSYVKCRYCFQVSFSKRSL